jgi:hypothetical protein
MKTNQRAAGGTIGTAFIAVMVIVLAIVFLLAVQYIVPLIVLAVGLLLIYLTRANKIGTIVGVVLIGSGLALLFLAYTQGTLSL